MGCHGYFLSAGGLHREQRSLDRAMKLGGKAFEKGQIFSAVVGWNPYASYALDKGGKKLSDSSMFSPDPISRNSLRCSSL